MLSWKRIWYKETEGSLLSAKKKIKLSRGLKEDYRLCVPFGRGSPQYDGLQPRKRIRNGGGLHSHDDCGLACPPKSPRDHRPELVHRSVERNGRDHRLSRGRELEQAGPELTRTIRKCPIIYSM